MSKSAPSFWIQLDLAAHRIRQRWTNLRPRSEPISIKCIFIGQQICALVLNPTRFSIKCIFIGQQIGALFFWVQLDLTFCCALYTLIHFLLTTKFILNCFIINEIEWNGKTDINKLLHRNEMKCMGIYYGISHKRIYCFLDDSLSNLLLAKFSGWFTATMNGCFILV